MATPEEQEYWRKIVIVHNYAKAILIYCEEADLNQKTFLQPWNELRNSLEHLVRYKACELGLLTPAESPEKYQLANLDRALGHEYRAFFDTCDWLSMVLRKRIREQLGPFIDYPEVIKEVIPHYYSELKPAIDELTQKAADIRTKKDIKGDVLAEVEHYNQVVLRLKSLVDGLSAKVPTLLELKSAKLRQQELDDHRDEKKDQRGANFRFKHAVIVAGLSVLGAGLLRWWFD